MEKKTNINSNSMSDMDIYARLLIVSDPLRDPVIRKVTRAVDFPPGSKGLNAGCGMLKNEEISKKRCQLAVRRK
jgi:hypothetical protein